MMSSHPNINQFFNYLTVKINILKQLSDKINPLITEL